MGSPNYEIDQQTVLIGVDWQRAFGEAVVVPGVEEALYNGRRLIARWRKLGRALILTRHIFNTPDQVGRLADFLPGIYEALQQDSPLVEFHKGIYQPGDAVVDKTRFNAFMGTDLDQQLQALGASTLVVCGLTTPICVAGTVAGANERDCRVIVAADACASQAMGDTTPEASHAAAIARLGTLFAEVKSTAEILHITDRA